MMTLDIPIAVIRKACDTHGSPTTKRISNNAFSHYKPGIFFIVRPARLYISPDRLSHSLKTLFYFLTQSRQFLEP